MPRLRICGVPFTVTMSAQIADGQGAGLCLAPLAQIYIDRHIPAEMRRVVAWHEALHAVDWLANLGLSHRKVYNLSTACAEVSQQLEGASWLR